MTRVARRMFISAALAMTAAGTASAQFALPTETTETRWGGTFYGGGDVDSLGNHQLGLRASYRLLQIKPLMRVAPELGLEVRKNYALIKAGGRADSRELLRISGFIGGGVMRIQDFTNQKGSDDAVTSSETWYYHFGAKLRLPGLGGLPLVGGFLGGLPIDGVSVFAGQEVNGLDPPGIEGNVESSVDEWYTHSIQFGLMVGSVSGFFE